MSTCTNITLERIRAEITVGSLTFVTPFIKSFNVTRSRTQLSASFSASIQVPATTVFPVHSDVVIRAGTVDNMQTIFTGTVLTVTVNPDFERGTFYIVNLAGQDRFWELEGKTFSRRQITRGASRFAAIVGIASKAPQRGISLEKRLGSGALGGNERIPSADTNIREHSKLVKTDRVAVDPFGAAKPPETTDPNQAASAVSGVIRISPQAVSLSPGVSVLFTVQGVTFTPGDTWAVSDTQIGTLVDNQDGTSTYTQQAIGQNTITYTQASSGLTGTATAVGIPIHDHSNLGQGGPAFGVFGSE